MEGTDVKETKTQDTKTNVDDNKETGTNKETSSVDVEKVKGDAIAEYLKTLGIEDSDTLKNIVNKAKEDEEKNKTELQKKDDTLTATTKELVEERNARMLAEAKLLAITLGAKTELVDDLVIVAKSKVTKDKDIKAVMTEIKDSDSGKVYFAEKEKEEEKHKGTVTRTKVKNEEKQKINGKETKEEKHAGTMAERLLSGRKKPKNYYYK